MIEQIRSDFEEWYSNQKLDQISTWHPPGTLEFQQEQFPNGRYTAFSTKQMCWEVWQAAYAKYGKKNENPFGAKIQAAQAEIVAAECEIIDTEFGKVEVQSVTIMPHNSTRNHTDTVVETEKEAEEAGIKYIPEEDGEYWTAEQILDHMIRNIRSEDIPTILALPKEADMIRFHSSVGRWIRNTFKLWDLNNPHLDGYHPDEFSFEILKGIWRAIQRREMIGL